MGGLVAELLLLMLFPNMSPFTFTVEKSANGELFEGEAGKGEGLEENGEEVEGGGKAVLEAKGDVLEFGGEVKLIAPFEVVKSGEGFGG